ncbi:Uncharacterised protein [Halioglobus japonicus]|nr:Uncharacterised protein [Halioglobus japonicus]
MTVPASEQLSPAELMPLFSSVAIPYTGHRGARKCKWFGSDSERHYLKNPHPKFGPDDIEYSFNRHGYRCIEFDTRDTFDKDHLHLLTLGESHALGMGLPEELTYGYLVAQKIQAHTGRPVQHWNLSQGGISAEYIARILPTALAVLQPDFVILNFPNKHRREYIFDDGNYLTCGDGDQVAGSVYTVDRHEAVKKAHFEHAHEDSNTFNQWKLFIVCQRHLLAHKVMWAAQAGFGLPQRFNQYIAMQNLSPTRIMAIGKEAYEDNPGMWLARDGKHAGVAPHAGLADNIYQLFVREYTQELEQLAASQSQRTG